eukprot:TRINITY_DN3335_c0_g2_i2.p1 TRINITY_DN3335_c0_g2~~TRINITY_DN3335_c0_g2_i2.p1  ORF type:complete len:224 (+),score=63.20 TRINITY_DN3335_c0_g2_i2:194-865(+)
MIGRGKSDRLENKEDYNYGTYTAIAAAFLTHLNLSDNVYWIGTSMGGIIGMYLTSLKNTIITKLVLNDMGAVISGEALSRLSQYTGNEPIFNSIEESVPHFKKIYSQFGNLTNEQWIHLSKNSLIYDESSKGYIRNYDPSINILFQSIKEWKDVEQWEIWDKIKANLLIYRGKDSDLLTSKTIELMRTRGPSFQLLEFDNVGHAPALMCDEQINPIIQFLDKN